MDENALSNNIQDNIINKPTGVHNAIIILMNKIRV